jgi:hypothetical protein
MEIRIYELALETLQARKTALESEIQSLKAKLEREVIAKTVAPATAKRKSRSAAQRRAHAERMRAIWAARKAKASKPKLPKKATPVKQKPGTKAAANTVRSAKMKAYWAKRRAEKAEK